MYVCIVLHMRPLSSLALCCTHSVPPTYRLFHHRRLASTDVSQAPPPHHSVQISPLQRGVLRTKQVKEGALSPVPLCHSTLSGLPRKLIWFSLPPALPLEGDLHKLKDLLCYSPAVPPTWHAGAHRVGAGSEYIVFFLGTGVPGTD